MAIVLFNDFTFFSYDNTSTEFFTRLNASIISCLFPIKIISPVRDKVLANPELARGEAAPLEELIRDLPVPPHDCGWATFLRNHDELTLDRLSPAERDEVFAAFAPEEDMRIYGHGSAAGPRRCSAETAPGCGWRGRWCSRCPARP